MLAGLSTFTAGPPREELSASHEEKVSPGVLSSNQNPTPFPTCFRPAIRLHGVGSFGYAGSCPERV